MTPGPNRALASLARSSYLDALMRGTAGFVHSCSEGARRLASQAGEPALNAKRRDLVLDLAPALSAWQLGLEQRINDALQMLRSGRPLDSRIEGSSTWGPVGQLTLVDDSAVERGLLVSSMAQAISDLAGSEYTDLSSRLQVVSGTAATGDTTEAAGDVLRPQMVARWAMDSWVAAGLAAAHWGTLQNVLHTEASHWAQEAYHEANRLLLDNGVCPEVDLRPFIRRAKSGGPILQPARPSAAVAPPDQGMGQVVGGVTRPSGNSGLQPLGQPYEETRLMTQAQGFSPRAVAQAQVAMSKLNQVVARQVPDFDPTAVVGAGVAVHVSPALGQAISDAQRLVQTHTRSDAVGVASSPAALVQDLQNSRQALKKAASTPVERATIEVVALLFQSILMEERLPASIRVWFARLQMPVLRVAVSEPDFFATLNHPARALIDRMGACVMGFASGEEGHEDALYKEIRRIVQVVEAYPDTGRRVFQTVLTEFEKFLERYFRDENEASRKGVSLAQQVEQRETWAIQYTIEMRKMLETVPVHEGVREFLFRVWADVLAHSAVQTEPSSDETRALKRAAADLIWSASAKTSREERADVLRRLPPLLKTVREGMARAGLAQDKQDEHIHSLNAALAAAFSARSAAISSAHLQAVTERLDALDEILPNIADMELDEQTLRDLSGHESDDLEIVAEGGTMPTPAMMGWARELHIGSWFQLDYRGKHEPVQLVWHGLQKQLALFVTPAGRGILFQLHRLGSFLQAGLLVPVEEETLTTRATRDALAKLDADPQRLLS
ncbi:MAG: DUF1631 family protein [Burkholderiales bacterium]|nr:DUF1631 family protein [Burkholderiales bacterium]